MKRILSSFKGIASTKILMHVFNHQGHKMQHVLIIHEVEAYPAWKAIFDQAAEIRKQAGVKASDFIYLQEIERGVL